MNLWCIWRWGHTFGLLYLQDNLKDPKLPAAEFANGSTLHALPMLGICSFIHKLQGKCRAWCLLPQGCLVWGFSLLKPAALPSWSPSCCWFNRGARGAVAAHRGSEGQAGLSQEQLLPALGHSTLQSSPRACTHCWGTQEQPWAWAELPWVDLCCMHKWG